MITPSVSTSIISLEVPWCLPLLFIPIFSEEYEPESVVKSDGGLQGASRATLSLLVEQPLTTVAAQTMEHAILKYNTVYRQKINYILKAEAIIRKAHSLWHFEDWL